MNPDYNDQPERPGRRRFLKGAAVTALAATATGAGTAVLRNGGTNGTTITPNIPTAVATVPPSSLPVISSDANALTRLAAAQAENMRLQAALDGLQRRLDGLQNGNDSATGEAESLRLELNSAQSRLGMLGGLVTLYEQLDSVNLDQVLDDGVAAISSDMTTFLNNLGPLGDGIFHGRSVLDELDEQIPLLENGRIWLDAQGQKLASFFDAVERLLANAADSVGSFLEMFNDWAQKVLRWLPFGLGENTAALLDATIDLLQEMPATVSGMDVNVAQPLDLWLGPLDKPDVPLRSNLITPVREQVLARAEQAISEAQAVEQNYRAQLAQPTATAVAQRRTIREAIANYRQQHNF